LTQDVQIEIMKKL